jgi:hypothetical protein
MRFALLLVSLLIPSIAHAGRWIPYTDGRVGGCFQNENGNLYGCTPQPTNSNRSREYDSEQLRDDSRVEALEFRTHNLESQNRALRAYRDRQRALDNAEALEMQKRARTQNDYFSALEVEASKRRYRQWLDARSGCSTREYEDQLEKLGLKRHPSLEGLCVPIRSVPGVISLQGCPPC